VRVDVIDAMSRQFGWLQFTSEAPERLEGPAATQPGSANPQIILLDLTATALDDNAERTKSTLVKARLSGPRGEITAQAKARYELHRKAQRRIELDLDYVDHHSFWIDLALLWQTIGAVIRADGAY